LEKDVGERFTDKTDGVGWEAHPVFSATVLAIKLFTFQKTGIFTTPEPRH